MIVASMSARSGISRKLRKLHKLRKLRKLRKIALSITNSGNRAVAPR